MQIFVNKNRSCTRVLLLEEYVPSLILISETSMFRNFLAVGCDAIDELSEDIRKEKLDMGILCVAKNGDGSLFQKF